MDFSFNESYFVIANPNIDDNEDLRVPQVNSYWAAFDHFIVKKKKSHALIVLPTGVGKTGLIGLLPYSISQGRVLIITPQLTIKDTVIDSLNPEEPDNFWLKRKVFSNINELPNLIEYEGDSTKKEVMDAANIVVINIQKLQKRLDSSLLNFLPENYFDMIIIDEAHHSTAKTWIETILHFSNAKVIKLTGTPFRTDNEKITGDLVYKYHLSQAMANGYVKSLENLTYIPDKLTLTIDNDPTKVYSVDEIYEMGLKDEDWVSRSVAYSNECSEKVVDESIKLLNQKLASSHVPHKIIAVACSIPHAIQIQKLYESKGYKTALIHSKMEEDKEAVMKDVENHRVQVVVNVSMLGEGYDHPYLSIAAIFRPFRNPLPYVQFIGRILRNIPNEEVSNASDNLGQIVSHEHLGLKELWVYYKKEIQESEIIKTLKEYDDFDFEDEDDNRSKPGTTQDRSIGTAEELGTGKVISEAYMTTELIKKHQAEEKIREEKIHQLQELLKITKEQAASIYDQNKSKDSEIKRPDKYFARKRKNIDERIREEIVPDLISKYNIDQKADNLKSCILFKGKYFWIPSKVKDNGGMLALYLNAYLKNEIGKQRDNWVISDYDIAHEKLDSLTEFLDKVLESVVG